MACSSNLIMSRAKIVCKVQNWLTDKHNQKPLPEALFTTEQLRTIPGPLVLSSSQHEAALGCSRTSTPSK